MSRRLIAILLSLVFTLMLAPAAVAQESEAEEVVITAFLEVADASWDYSQNYFLNQVAEKTGVRLDTTGFVFSSNDAPTQKQLVLASGNYPEIFLMRDNGAFTYAEMYKYGMQDGFFVPIQDLIAENAPKIQAILDAEPAYVNMHTAPDGNMYAVTRFSECQHALGYYKMYVNTDWLTKLNLEMPTDLDEFKDMLIAFRDSDPNGNGVKDEIALTARGDTLFTGYIFNSYIDTDMVKGKYTRIEDGVVKFSANTQEFKDALAYMRDLYEEGLIDPNSFTQDSTQLKQTVCGETPLVGTFSASGIFNMDMNNEYVYQNYKIMMPMKGYNGTQIANSSNVMDANVKGYFLITDICENPEAACRFVDEFVDPDMSMIASYGEEGVAWKYAEPGQTNILGGEYLYEFTGEDPKDNQVISAGPQNGLKMHRAAWSPMATEEELMTNPAIYEARIEDETAKLSAYFSESMPSYFFFEGDELEEYEELYSMLKTYVNQSIAEFIVGTKSLDTDWDAYCANLDAYGVDRFVELLQKGYDMYSAL